MPSAANLPPEVRAARRALGTYHPSDTPAAAPALTVLAQSSDDVAGILREVADADSIDIIGVLPVQCTQTLMALQSELTEDGTPTTKPQMVRYFTPARDRVTLYRQPGVLGTLVQRWIAGVTGLRNWLQPRNAGPDATDRLTVYEFDDMYLDCILYARKDDVTWAATLSQLPLLTSVRDSQPEALAVLVASRMSAEQVAELDTYVSILADQAVRLSPRQIRCVSTEEKDRGDGFTPVISRISPYGRLAEGDVEPIAVVAVRANTASGPCVLLKERTSRNSRDDFGTLSLISERILVEDLSELMRGPLHPNQDRALDELWIRAGQPKKFEIPERTFRKAAQRELFLTCGLDVHEDRLQLTGDCILEREDQHTFLGFFVYRLDLIRSASNDELKAAQAWNSDLAIVSIRDLYGRQYRPRLNRLLRRRETWLLDTVFTDDELTVQGGPE